MTLKEKVSNYFIGNHIHEHHKKARAFLQEYCTTDDLEKLLKESKKEERIEHTIEKVIPNAFLLLGATYGITTKTMPYEILAFGEILRVTASIMGQKFRERKQEEIKYIIESSSRTAQIIEETQRLRENHEKFIKKMREKKYGEDWKNLE